MMISTLPTPAPGHRKTNLTLPPVMTAAFP
jgi:hypothetical protein